MKKNSLEHEVCRSELHSVAIVILNIMHSDRELQNSLQTLEQELMTIRNIIKHFFDNIDKPPIDRYIGILEWAFAQSFLNNLEMNIFEIPSLDEIMNLFSTHPKIRIVD